MGSAAPTHQRWSTAEDGGFSEEEEGGGGGTSDEDESLTIAGLVADGAGGGRRTSFRGAARLALGAVRASNRAAKYIDTEPSGSSRREESI